MTPTRQALAAVTVTMLLSGCAGQHPTGGHGQPRADESTGDVDGVHDMAGMAPVAAPHDAADWNAADASYLTMMVAHHSQALDLAELAADRAADPRVRALAASLDAGQGREIVVMATWLVDHGQPEPTPESVAAISATGMPGMLTREQLDALAATDGAAFDRRFLESMVQHHQGAVAMAQAVLGTGEDVRVTEMAAEVVAGQNAEIAQMRLLLEDLQ